MSNAPTQPGQSNEAALLVDDLDSPEPIDQAQQWYNQYKDLSYADIARRMVELKKEVSAADILCKARKAEFEVLSLRVVPERMLKDEQTSVRLKGIGRLGVTQDAYCTVIPGLKTDLLEFLKQDPENALLVKEDINSSTLKSLVKDMAAKDSEEAGELDLESAFAETPEDELSDFQKILKYVNYTPFMRASVTKG